MTVTQTGLLEHGPSLRKSTASGRRTACVGQRVAHNGFCHAQSGRCSATCVCNQCRAVACRQAVLGRVHHRGRGRRCLGASKLGSAAREVLVAQFRNNSALPGLLRIPIHHPCKRLSVGGGLANLPAEWDSIAVLPCRKNALDS